MIKIPELSQMLECGVHFGHQLSKRHPKMEPFIHTSRNRIAIINLEKTASKLAEALAFASDVASTGGVILFVSSKRQAKEIIQRCAENCGMPFVNSRWLGGTFTNFANISRLTKKLKELEQKTASGELAKYTKKEQLDFEREIARLTELVGGMKNMIKLPEAVFVVDIKKDDNAVKESNKKKVPVIAICDTNVNPEAVRYPIPANDDAVKSIDLICGLMAEAVLEGKAQMQNQTVKK